jgi:DNA-binding transcriptional MerR regulator
MADELSSGDLARATGTTVRTIRFYEEEGLLKPSMVTDGGRRRYSDGDLERLRLITDLREVGLSICEIRSILQLRAGCRTAAEFAARFRDVVEVHLEHAERRLERLRRLRREIRDSLAAVEARLAATPHDECACAVAGQPEAPRFVKVLARLDGCPCGCGEPSHAGGVARHQGGRLPSA